MSHRTTDYLRKNGFVKYVMILRLFLTEDEKEIYKVSKQVQSYFPQMALVN